MPEHWLAGRVGVVTGASRGIGQASAVAIARAGCHVVIAARTQLGLDETCAMVQDVGGQATAVVADVSRADDVERIFDIYVTKATEEGHGVGLGLPLSRRLARLLGGELKAVSRPGRGARLVLELPAAPRE